MGQGSWEKEEEEEVGLALLSNGSKLLTQFKSLGQLKRNLLPLILLNRIYYCKNILSFIFYFSISRYVPQLYS